jgi:hypothetical protein
MAEQYFFYKKGNILVVKDYDIMLDSYESSDSLVNDYKGLKIMQSSINRKSNFLKINDEVLRFEPVQIINKLLADTAKMAIYQEKKNDIPYMHHEYNLPEAFMQIIQETDRYNVTLTFDRIDFERKPKGAPVVTSAVGKYLIKIK